MNVKEQTIYSRAYLVGFALCIAIEALGSVEDESIFKAMNTRLALLNEPPLTLEEMNLLNTVGVRMLAFFNK